MILFRPDLGTLSRIANCGLLLSSTIDYYGVTFDHLVSTDDDLDPEVLQINIIEMDDDEGAYANEHLPFPVDPAEYTGKRVLAVPRCCQKRKGTQDRARVNESVVESEKARKELERTYAQIRERKEPGQGKKTFWFDRD